MLKAQSLIESSQRIGRSHYRHRPGRDVFPAVLREPCDFVMLVTRQPASSTSWSVLSRRVLRGAFPSFLRRILNVSGQECANYFDDGGYPKPCRKRQL
jgi:hypothetical protein